MDKPFMILKPSITVALLPIFLRNLIYSLPFALVLFGLSFLFQKYITFELVTIILILAGFSIIVSLGPLLLKIIVFFNTKYYFLSTHVVSELKIFRVKRESVPYHQIRNIEVHVNLWNRICGTGDIIIHTAEDKLPDLVLYYIKNPEKIEHSMYSMMHTHKKIP